MLGLDFDFKSKGFQAVEFDHGNLQISIFQHEYYKKIPPDKKGQRLEASLIPNSASDGTMSFNEFIKRRSSLLVEKANTLIRNGCL